MCREHWQQEIPTTNSQTSGVREAYLARRTAVHQFKFIDPFGIDIFTDAKPIDHILLDKDNIIFSQVLGYISVLILFFFLFG